MTIASHSLFPYLPEIPNISHKARPEGVTDAQTNVPGTDQASVQGPANEYSPVIQKVLSYVINHDLMDDQETAHSSLEHQDSLGQRNVEHWESSVSYFDPRSLSRLSLSIVSARKIPPLMPSTLQVNVPPTRPCIFLNACRLYVPVEFLPESFPYARHRRSRSQQPEVDRMPSTIESSGNPGSTEVWSTTKRHAAEEEEEETRLLGRYMCVTFSHSISFIFVAG